MNLKIVVGISKLNCLCIGVIVSNQILHNVKSSRHPSIIDHLSFTSLISTSRSQLFTSLAHACENFLGDTFSDILHLNCIEREKNKAAKIRNKVTAISCNTDKT